MPLAIYPKIAQEPTAKILKNGSDYFAFLD
jgi:hypothetical protein